MNNFWKEKDKDIRVAPAEETTGSNPKKLYKKNKRSIKDVAGLVSALSFHDYLNEIDKDQD